MQNQTITMLHETAIEIGGGGILGGYLSTFVWAKGSWQEHLGVVLGALLAVSLGRPWRPSSPPPPAFTAASDSPQKP